MNLPRYIRRNGWTPLHLWMGLLLGALGVALTFSAWKDIFMIAQTDEESSQIKIALLIFVALVWVRRERFRNCQPRGLMVGPMLVLVGWVFTMWGLYSDGQLFGMNIGQVLYWHTGALMVVVGAVLSVLGTDVIRHFFPAVVVLLFLIPVPGQIRQMIAFPLQGVMAESVFWLFNLAGSDISLNGYQLQINGNSVAVAEACNGMRMVFPLVLVSYGYAFFTSLRGYVRVIIVGLSLPMAVLCNFIRMIPTVWMYGNTDYTLWGMSGEKIAELFHDTAGFIMIVVAFGLLISIISVLRWAMIPVSPYTLARD